MIGMEIGTRSGIAVYIESAYGLPGLGRLSVSVLIGTIGLDLPFILGIVVVITTIVLVTNLVVDTLYAIIDPRAGETLRARRSRSLVGTLT